MIRGMQRKFVLVSMGAFLLVLAVIISAINIVNYTGVVREADELLELLSENKGRFPQMHGGMHPMLPGGMSPETPYESRYFSVTFNRNTGNVMQVETSRIASIDTTQAIAYGQTALEEKRDRGFAENFRYLVDAEENTIRVVFLDCGRKIEACKGFMLASAGISLGGYLVVFFLIAYFSSRIVRPISESYEKQKQFITNAGHEIKTPLTIIHADADVLEMELGENEFLEDIQKQTKRLGELTNYLVELARMEEDGRELRMIDFPFSDVVSEATSSFQALAQTRNKCVVCNVQPMLTLKGNEKAIRQLVGILLDNALKYSPEESEIVLTVQRQSGGIALLVRNETLHPVPQESLPHLFERFYRLDPSRNSQTGGYGIGLSVAKAIVTAHGGKIKATTERDKEICFTVVFPT